MKMIDKFGYMNKNFLKGWTYNTKQNKKKKQKPHKNTKPTNY